MHARSINLLVGVDQAQGPPTPARRLRRRIGGWRPGGEFSKKGKPGHLAKASPVSDCSFPSRLRAISFTSTNRKRGNSRAISKAKAINSPRR